MIVALQCQLRKWIYEFLQLSCLFFAFYQDRMSIEIKLQGLVMLHSLLRVFILFIRKIND